MPTPDQIEAVARAIWESYEGQVAGVHFDDPIVRGNAFREGKAIQQATAAIAAYEASRPVVSDEALLAAYDAGHDEAVARYMREHNGVPDWPAPDRTYHRTYDLAGIRAVRARLEGGGDG